MLSFPISKRRACAKINTKVSQILLIRNSLVAMKCNEAAHVLADYPFCLCSCGVCIQHVVILVWKVLS